MEKPVRDAGGLASDRRNGDSKCEKHLENGTGLGDFLLGVKERDSLMTDHSQVLA